MRATPIPKAQEETEAPRGILPRVEGEAGTVCKHFQQAAEILGRRWNPQVISVLLVGSARFGEIRDRVPGISDNLLAERLRQLEDDGIVLRTVYDDRPVRIEYSLTKAGMGLEEAIDALAHWAERSYARAPART